jgi:hypothetical protein
MLSYNNIFANSLASRFWQCDLELSIKMVFTLAVRRFLYMYHQILEVLIRKKALGSFSFDVANTILAIETHRGDCLFMTITAQKDDH